MLSIFFMHWVVVMSKWVVNRIANYEIGFSHKSNVPVAFWIRLTKFANGIMQVTMWSSTKAKYQSLRRLVGDDLLRVMGYESVDTGLSEANPYPNRDVENFILRMATKDKPILASLIFALSAGIPDFDEIKDEVCRFLVVSLAARLPKNTITKQDSWARIGYSLQDEQGVSYIFESIRLKSMNVRRGENQTLQLRLYPRYPGDGLVVKRFMTESQVPWVDRAEIHDDLLVMKFCPREHALWQDCIEYLKTIVNVPMSNELIQLGQSYLSQVPSTSRPLQLSVVPPVKLLNDVPERFYCAISNEIMKDPVIVPGAGKSERCERAVITEWLSKSKNKTNPFTNEPGLKESDLVSDRELKNEIEGYFKKRKLKC